MKNEFHGYYRPTEEEFSQKFRECIFCFDTNVLLNLYRYKPDSRDKLIGVLRAFQDRIWLPHQVGLEYHRRRIDALLDQMGLCGKLEEILDSAIKQLEQLQRSSLFTVNAMVDPIKRQLASTKKKLNGKKDKKRDFMTEDPVFDALTELFNGKVGKPYSIEEYKELFKKGKERYDSKTPPGYMDKSNNPNDTDQYGDLIIWFQIIDFAKTEAKPIILVTDDAKEDWWREIRGERLGPRPELISEFTAATGGEKWIYMYSTEQFLKYSQKYLNTQIEQEVIKEAEAIEKKDAENEKIRMALTPQQIQLALSETPSEIIRRALSDTPSELVRRALAELPTEQLRRTLAEMPSNIMRQALAGAFKDNSESSIETARPLLRKDWDEYVKQFKPLSEVLGSPSEVDTEPS